jgi:hypothetical protein
MIECNHCHANNPEDIKICLACGQSFLNVDGIAKDKLHNIFDFNEPENLVFQIRYYFFKILKCRIETELDANGYRKYFDHFHSTGFYKKFDTRVQRLSEQLMEIQNQNILQKAEKIDQLLNQVLQSFIDYFIIVYCEPLHKMKLPDAILRYENAQKESVDLKQMIFDYLDFENEKDRVYKDFLTLRTNKLENAKAAFLFSGKDEKLFFLCDQTVFGSCKEGFAMTDKALYWKAHFNEAEMVFFKELKNIKRESEWITINGLFFNVNRTINYKMLLLLKKLKTLFP